MAPPMMEQLPVLRKIFKWFKGDGIKIESPLFKIHHQLNTLVLMVGFVYISVENHLDESILCQTPPAISAYAKSYCWIHGTAYVHKHLQGKATGCFVDQSRIKSEEDGRITAYYLWLPYLLTFCVIFAKFPHSMWKSFFENGLIQALMDGKSQPEQQDFPTAQFQNSFVMSPGGNPGVNNGFPGGNNGGGQSGWKGKNKGNNGGRGSQDNSSGIARNFLDFRLRYAGYQRSFFFWETMNMFMVILSFILTHWLLNRQFFSYGMSVLDYIGTPKRIEGQYMTHDPQCELFPTEVACTFSVGASTGGIDRSNYLCILGNNLFNQKYFFILWLWWSFLIAVSICGLIYRLARLFIPAFSKNRLLRRVHGRELRHLTLNCHDCFVLEMLLDNLAPRLMEQVLDEIERISEAAANQMSQLKFNLNSNTMTNMNSVKLNFGTLDNVDSIGKSPLINGSCKNSETSLTESDHARMANGKCKESTTPV